MTENFPPELRQKPLKSVRIPARFSLPDKKFSRQSAYRHRLVQLLILADYPFVLESVIGNDHLADCSPIIEAHCNSGGQFILAGKLRLLARVTTLTLVTRMPEYEHWLYECEFYAYREELSNVQVQAIANNFRNSEFALRIFYHACHDYFLIETAEDPLPCIKHIQDICSQEGRKTFH